METDPQVLLQTIIRREGRSFLQYLRDAFPWTTMANRGVLDELHKLIDEEAEAVHAMVVYLFNHKQAPPHLGPFPSSFTTMNYIALDHLLPILVEQQSKAIHELELDLTLVDDPDVAELLQDLLTLKNSHLEQLRSLASRCSNQPPAAAS